ncbi:MAG: M48 family metalloprotease [Arenicella sp.]
MALTNQPFKQVLLNLMSALNRGFRTLLLLFVCAMTYGCATNPETGKTTLITISEEHEQLLGNKLHEKIMEEERVYSDQELQAYVSLIGNHIASFSNRPNIDYRFIVLDSEDINAFAVPDGHIYITKNMLAHFNKESHLAAVLAHEIGHIAARHTARKLAQDKMYGSITGPVRFLSWAIPHVGPWVGQFVSDKLGKSRAAYVKGYGRNLELEADKLGAKYLALAGYAPEDMIEVLTILKDQEQYLTMQVQQDLRQDVGISYHASSTSTHPSNDQRLQEVILAAEDYLKNEDLQADRRDYLMMVDGLTATNSQRYAMERNGVEMRSINARFKGYFPLNFRAYRENTLPKEENRLLLPASDTALDFIALDSINHQYAVYDDQGRFDGYENENTKSAVLIKILELGESISPKQFLLNYLQENSAAVDYIAGEKMKTPYGTGFFMRSHTTRDFQELGFIGKKKNAGAEHMQGVVFIGTQAVVLESYGGVFNYDQMPHRRIFKSIMRNIRPTNAGDQLHDEVPEYTYGIALKTVEPGETMASIAQDIIMVDAETKLRLINGFYPEGEPEYGQTIKTFADKDKQ